MSTSAPSGSAAIASWKLLTGTEGVSGSPSGRRSGPIVSTPTIRNSQRRSSFSSGASRRARVTLGSPAQVGALDAEDDAEPGRHDAHGGADQHPTLCGVLGG